MITDYLDEIRSILNATYPGWIGISDPRFVADEIDYKRAAIAKASNRLSKSAISDLIDRGRFAEVIERLEELGKEPHFLYLATPRTGDLSILYEPTLDKEAFANQILDLLHGEGSSPERLARYSAWVDQSDLSNKWTFPTYFLFLTDPQHNLFIKPQAVSRFLDLVKADFKLGSHPRAIPYARLLEIAGQLQKELIGIKTDDMVPIHSIIWVVGRLGYKMGVQELNEERLRLLLRLLDEFGRDFVSTGEGSFHLAMYPEVREAGQQNYEQVLAARDNGEDITDLVLTKLLPHRGNDSNRARGAWIHNAPAISADIKTWFENAGWVDPKDWPSISRAIFEFVERVIEDPDSLDAACKRFAESEYSKGFQTGMLTPILSAILPDQMILINNKSRAVVNHFLGLRHSQRISDYASLNTAAHYLIHRIREPLIALLPAGVSAKEGFDAFCHWMVAIKGYRFGRTQAWKVTVENSATWALWEEGGYAGLSESELGDTKSIKKKVWEKTRATILDSNPGATGEGLDEVWRLASETQEGDLILATSGTDRVIGIGMIIGPYEYHEGAALQHRVPVTWHDTSMRAISEPAWRARFHDIDPRQVERLRALPPIGKIRGALNSRAFELLKGIHDTPTRDFYIEHQEDFQIHVEDPVKELLNGIAALLPPSMKEVMETERRLFSRFPKNDFGRGGAWDYYWGAFYPKGGKRIAGAQLFFWVNHERIEYGFYIGEYGDEQRARFLNNVKKRRDALLAALGPRLDQDRYLFGAQRDEDGRLDPESGWSTLHEWLPRIEEGHLSVRVSKPKTEVLSTPQSDLQDQVLDAFRQLFPLVLLAISDDPLTAISEYWVPEEEGEEIQPEYSLEQCADDTGFEVGTLRTWVTAAHRKGQAIFYGPPGTGKTFMAEHVARHMVGGGDGFVELVQFHPAYAYEDFIQGIRPLTRADGALEYQMVPGRFLEFCRKAQNRAGACVLIVDEINRANLSRVFGELMYLLEYRDRDIPLSGGGTFRIPKNIRMLGTMNTADRSIALVDHALRRRFAFVPLRPQFEILRAYHDETGQSVEALIEKLTQINKAIGDPNYHLGTTFFMDPELGDNLETIWRMEIEPYLEEFFFDELGTVERFRWDKVGGEVSV